MVNSSTAAAHAHASPRHRGGGPVTRAVSRWRFRSRPVSHGLTVQAEALVGGPAPRAGRRVDAARRQCDAARPVATPRDVRSAGERRRTRRGLGKPADKFPNWAHSTRRGGARISSQNCTEWKRKALLESNAANGVLLHCHAEVGEGGLLFRFSFLLPQPLS